MKNESFREVFTEDEITSIVSEVESQVFGAIPDYVLNLKGKWDSDYAPEDYFEEFKISIQTFIEESRSHRPSVMQEVEREVQKAIESMEEDYEEPKRVLAPSTKHVESSIEQLFSDIDE